MGNNMTICDEINEILRNHDAENIKIEYKRRKLLDSKQGQEKLCFAIVALANRYGGKLILGINDDVTFEGKDIFNVDSDKGTITNIIHNHISPTIEYDMEFLSCKKGDILVINILKRKGIPHAYINGRNGSDIKERIYYIRTSHGKRLVSDGQLQWLFEHQDDPDFDHPFRIVINYRKDSLQIPPPPYIEQPRSVSNFGFLINNMLQSDVDIVKKDWDTIQSFFIEIAPYALIHSFSWHFMNSWLVETRRYNGGSLTKPMPNKVNSKIILPREVPGVQNDSLLASLERNFSLVFGLTGVQEFHVPENTDLEIHFYEGRKSVLSLKNKDFSIDISFNKFSWGEGAHQTHPIKEAYQSNDRKLFQHVEMNCTCSASFNFPEDNLELFNEYYHYANTIKDLLKSDFDYDNFIERLPPSKLYTIENKLDAIYKLLSEP